VFVGVEFQVLVFPLHVRLSRNEQKHKIKQSRINPFKSSRSRCPENDFTVVEVVLPGWGNIQVGFVTYFSPAFESHMVTLLAQQAKDLELELTS
jgi:hypothetical protein